MERALPVMGRDRPAGRGHRLVRAAAQEQEQYVFRAHVESAHALVAEKQSQTEIVFVEGTGARQVVDIERGLENGIQLGHRGPHGHPVCLYFDLRYPRHVQLSLKCRLSKAPKNWAMMLTF
jgi:hypothetical protein